MSTSLDILVIETIVGWSSHLETAGEICLRYRDKGCNVAFAYLGKGNPDDQNIEEESTLLKRSYKSDIKYRVQQFSEIIYDEGIEVISPPKLSLEIRNEIRDCSYFKPENLNDLRDFSYKGARIGQGVLSSLISKTHDSAPDLTECLPLMKRYLKESARVFEQTLQLIEQFSPSKVVTFNGRFALSKAIVEACKCKNTEILLHERGADYTRFILQDRPIHDIGHVRKQIKKAWEEADREKEKIAHKFFSKKRQGDGIGWYSFVEQQEKGTAPERSEKERIVYFSSSDDEYAAVGDMVEHPLFTSQREAVEWLIEYFSQSENAELYIRVHPHLVKKAKGEREWWHSLSGKNVEIIEAESPVDSYSLAQSADKVITYGSTIGIEATYWETPSILLGDAIYRGFNCVYEPDTLEKASKLINQAQLPALPQNNCLPYGYYMMTFGEKYKYYNPVSLSEGTFLGNELSTDSPLIRLLKKLEIKHHLRKIYTKIFKA